MLFANLRPLLDSVNPQLPAFQKAGLSDQGEVRWVASCLVENGGFLLEKGGFLLRIWSFLSLLGSSFFRVFGSFADRLGRLLEVVRCFYKSGRCFRLWEGGLRQRVVHIGILHFRIASLNSHIGILHFPIASLNSHIGILHAPIATNVANSGVNEFSAEINECICGLYDCRITFYERPSASTPHIFPIKPLQIASTCAPVAVMSLSMTKQQTKHNTTQHQHQKTYG